MNNPPLPAAPAPTLGLRVTMVLEFALRGAWLPLSWGSMGKDGLAFTEPQLVT